MFPIDQPKLIVHHADGQDEVDIAECSEELALFAAAVSGGENKVEASGGAESVGMSPRLSFDEAFADAVAKLPPSTPTHPDSLTSVDVLHIGALFGGIAGFHHLVVRIRAISD